MVEAVEALVGREHIVSGVAILPIDQKPEHHSIKTTPPSELEPIERHYAAYHNLPDAHSLAATRRVLELCAGLESDDLVLALVSGGGSALLSLPAHINGSYLISKS